MQALVVAFIVVFCAAYAGWVLMPGSARRALAGALLKLPMPSTLNVRLRKAATASSGCGCDGCDAATPSQVRTGAPQPVTFHPRPPR